DAVGDVAQAGPDGVDDPPAGPLQPRVDAEQAQARPPLPPARTGAGTVSQRAPPQAALSRSITCSSISKLAETVCTSSLSSSTSISFISVRAVSSSTGVVVTGFHTRPARSGAP